MEFVMVVGMFICVIGWISVPKNYYLAGGGVLLCMGPVFISGRQYDSGTGYMLIIVGIGLAAYGFKQLFAKGKKANRDKLLSIGGTKLDKFFVECVLADCTDFSKEKNVARAKMFADKYKLSYPDGIEALYKKGLEAHQAVSGKITEDANEELRKQEQEEYARLTRYARYSGKDKTNAMLTDRMKELRKKAKNQDEAADMLMRSAIQKEQNWGIWGGIADGLAGPVAGVSMAVDVQRQNAQIRAQNEANCRAAMPVYMSITDRASDNRRNADAIEKEIGRLQERLMERKPQGEVLKMLNVVNPVVEVSETGAYRVSATVEVKKPLHVYGDVPAMADGVILAHVYEGGNEIGTAELVLPVNGVFTKTGVVGMGLSGADSKKKQTVKFTEGDLWLLEK